MKTQRTPALVAALSGLAAGAGALGQATPPPSRVVPWGSDSGPVSWRGGEARDERAVYSTVVTAPGAPWVRLSFGAVQLAGAPEDGTGSYLRITSLKDQKVQ